MKSYLTKLATSISLALAASMPAMAQNCSASASANAGDEVTVFAILHTGDANENGEGEPLTVNISNGGSTLAFPDYEINHSQIFKAAATGPVSANGTITGYDGDESCEVSVSVNAKHRFTQSQKNVLIAVTSGFGTASGLSWALAEGCTLGIVTGPICGVPAGLVAAFATTVASISGTLLAIDPVDTNYTVIPVPVPAPFVAVTAVNGLTQVQADALNALLSNEAAMVGVLRATVTSINRASGAVAGGDTFWEQKQQGAINSFMVQFGGLMAKEASARQTLVTALASIPSVAISPQQVLTFEQRLASQGWRSDEVVAMLGIGDDPAFIQSARPLIFTQAINSVAGTVPAAFANPAFLSALREGVKTLSPFDGVPGAANCHGVSVSSLAYQYAGMPRAAAALGFSSVQDLQGAITNFCGR